LLLARLPFAKPMPIISVRGIKRPCCLSQKLNYFYEGGGDWKGLNNKRFTAFVPAQISLQLMPLQLLESLWFEEKIIMMILTVILGKLKK
jgi:hypothetical protein